MDMLVLIIILITVLFSRRGFHDELFFEKYKFETDGILVHKEYVRLFSAAFLHADWVHLAFNMVTLYFFGASVGNVLGVWNFLGVYLGSAVAGNALSLYIHRNHGDYSAIGASGAISGIVFSFVAAAPHNSIGMFFVPVAIPAWLFGVLFLLGSMYGIKRGSDGIGHDAHLGGAIAGVVLSVAIHPWILYANVWVISSMLVLFTAFMVLIVRLPEFLLIPHFGRYHVRRVVEHRRAEADAADKNELDKLLEKIATRGGVDALSIWEKRKLRRLARRVAG